MENTITHELNERFRQLNWLLRRHGRPHRGPHGGPAADPEQGQGRILAMLKLRDGISTKELSYLLGIRTSSLNESLARMERAGLVRREPSEEDRRVMLVHLTDEGRATDQEEPAADGVYACLTAEEQTTLLGYLDRLVEAAESSIGEEARESFERMREARTRFGGGMTGGFSAEFRGGWSAGGRRPGGPEGGHGPHDGPPHRGPRHPGRGRHHHDDDPSRF
ncbi:MAG: MarR family transcriptional regulator [Propionibacteriaceae bacterium]|jgi:DNA-binding MarR family transcriptional regulator|nr:MarR family transcriptional regulator [Propionibacteriaceae bacterium]